MPVGRSRHVILGAAALAALVVLGACGSNNSGNGSPIERPSVAPSTPPTTSHAAPPSPAGSSSPTGTPARTAHPGTAVSTPTSPTTPTSKPSTPAPAPPTSTSKIATPVIPTSPSPPVTGTAPPTATSSPAATTYFAQSGASTHAYKPRVLIPSVDGSLSVGDMHWRVWTTERAVGAGVAHVNDCTPDCADGHYASHPVTVYLSQPRALCDSQYFTAIRLNGPDYRTRAHWTGIGCL